MKNLVLCIDWQKMYIKHFPCTTWEKRIKNATNLIKTARTSPETQIAYAFFTHPSDDELVLRCGDPSNSQTLPDAFYKAGKLPDNELVFKMLMPNKFDWIDFDDWITQFPPERIFMFGISMWSCVEKTVWGAIEKGWGDKIYVVPDASQPIDTKRSEKEKQIRQNWQKQLAKRYKGHVISSAQAERLLNDPTRKPRSIPLL